MIRAVSEVLIVGGGISGLSTAYFLSKAGIASTLIEKTNRLGGLIGTDQFEDCMLEAGPDAYLAAKTAATELADELGLRDELIGSQDSQRRIYIARRGQLIPLPSGMAMMVPGDLRAALESELFSFQTKLQFFGEIFYRPRVRVEDVTVQDFVASHFGKELVDWVAEPLLAGVYGGAVEQLSAKSVLPRFWAYEREYGSLIRGVRRESAKGSRAGSLFLSFRRGMQQMPDALHNAIRPFTRVIHAEVESIERQPDGWRVRAAGEWLEARELVLACPAHVSARLLQQAAPELASKLSLISYSSALLVTFVYRKTEIRHPLAGFGFLVPRAERKTIAAVTWIHRKFPCRILPSFAALRAFIVDPEATKLLGSQQELVLKLARADLQEFLGIDAEPLYSTFYSYPLSMPQYVVGHEGRVKEISVMVENIRGLSLLGNFFEGVGIPDCVRLARATANRIEKRLRTLADSHV
jgi:oxygen-dependent protoporphyrinogen oxidase